MKPPNLTPAERVALKKVLIASKRFWNAVSPKAQDERAENLIDAIMNLVKEMDHD